MGRWADAHFHEAVVQQLDALASEQQEPASPAACRSDTHAPSDKAAPWERPARRERTGAAMPNAAMDRCGRLSSAGTPVTARSVPGSGGGGALLTPEQALALLEANVPPRDSPGHVASALEVGSDKSPDKSSEEPERTQRQRVQTPPTTPRPQDAMPPPSPSALAQQPSSHAAVAVRTSGPVWDMLCVLMAPFSALWQALLLQLQVINAATGRGARQEAAMLQVDDGDEAAAKRELMCAEQEVLSLQQALTQARRRAAEAAERYSRIVHRRDGETQGTRRGSGYPDRGVHGASARSIEGWVKKATENIPDPHAHEPRPHIEHTFPRVWSCGSIDERHVAPAAIPTECASDAGPAQADKGILIRAASNNTVWTRASSFGHASRASSGGLPVAQRRLKLAECASDANTRQADQGHGIIRAASNHTVGTCASSFGHASSASSDALPVAQRRLKLASQQIQSMPDLFSAKARKGDDEVVGRRLAKNSTRGATDGPGYVETIGSVGRRGLRAADLQLRTASPRARSPSITSSLSDSGEVERPQQRRMYADRNVTASAAQAVTNQDDLPGSFGSQSDPRVPCVDRACSVTSTGSLHSADTQQWLEKLEMDADSADEDP